MTSLVISSLAFVFGFSFALAQAQNTSLVPHAKERQFQIELDAGRISVFGKTYKAAERCNEDTIMNPKELRVFTVKDSANVIVTWCTGSLDGVANWITIYRKDKRPVTWQVDPAPDKASITIEKLTAEVEAKL